MCSDYSRNAIRMAALMKLRVIHVFTHDSIGLGEDGPTYQSVEHIPSLRIIPGLDVWRPADGLETAVAWASAITRSAAYQEQLLPIALPAVAIEAAQPDFWRKYVGRTGAVLGMAGFGESAPAKDLSAHFGLTVERLVETVQAVTIGALRHA